MAETDVNKGKLIDWLTIRLKNNNHIIDGFSTWAKAQEVGTLGAWKGFLEKQHVSLTHRERMGLLSLVVREYPIEARVVVIASGEEITITAVLPKKGVVRVFHRDGKKSKNGFPLSEVMPFNRWSLTQIAGKNVRNNHAIRPGEPFQGLLFD